MGEGKIKRPPNLFRVLMISSMFLVFMHLVLLVGTGYAAQSNLPRETISQKTIPRGISRTRSIQFSNGDRYWMERLEFRGNSKGSYRINLKVEGAGGTFTYVTDNHGKKQWRTIPLGAKLPKACGFLQTSKEFWYISYPITYRINTNQTIKEEDNSRPIKVQRNQQGYALQAEFPQKANTIGELWVLQARQPLINWKNTDLTRRMLNLDMSVSGRWLWEGIYQLTPSSYYPTGKNVFWRFPDNYIARSFVRTGGSRLAEDLGWVMLHTVLQNQNTLGYWPTSPRSEWLWHDYQIGPGFYDSRFNTDFASLLIDGYNKYNDQTFLLAVERYAQWYLNYANNKHIIVKTDEQAGWLVPDYTWPQKHKQVHTSLNHQLSEVNFLYQLYLLEDNEQYRQLADQLVLGVKCTKNFWLRADGNLNYGYLNGKVVGTDYPYLTYNDLWLTQKHLEKIYGQRDGDLESLMKSKKLWMDRQGVEGYKK